jgi:hypothetical protein
MDKKKIREYIMHNAMPLVGHAITKLMKDGVIQDKHDLAHIQEEAVAGMMKSIKSYKPEMGSFASYALPTIIGAAKSAVAGQEARHYIPHDKARAKVEMARAGGEQSQGQAVGSTASDPSGRAAMESAGGVASGDEGGAMMGVSKETSPAAKFANQYRQYVDSVIRPKVQAKEAELKGTSAPAPQPAAQQAAPAEAPKPKVVRRDRMAPEQQERLKHIDAARLARGKGGSNGNQ